MRRAASHFGKALMLAATVATTLAVLAVLAFILVPRILGWQPVVVLSGSMEPAVPVGAVTFLAPVKPADVKPGDIISFRRGNARVTHRVVTVGTDLQGGLAFTTKGDANAEPDSGFVAASDLERREVLTVPHVGKLANFVRSRNGYYTMIVLPALIIIGTSAGSIVAELNRQRRKAVA